MEHGNPLKAWINSVFGGRAAPDPSPSAAPKSSLASDKELHTAGPVWLPEHGAIDPNNFLSFFAPVFWGTRDPERVKQLIAELVPLLPGGIHVADNMLTWLRNISFLDDPGFKKAYEANIQNSSDGAIAWRRYILACAGYHCIQLEGDFVECGVYRATGIKTVVDYLGGKQFPKQFYGYDTYDYNPVSADLRERSRWSVVR